MPEPFLQVFLALAWYSGVIVVMRLAGKRLAGQTTSFDLVVLITLAVVLQQTALREGPQNALVFVATVFGAHRTLALLCARSAKVRRLVRGAPRPLIRHGQVSFEALEDEGLSYEELLAGLRKLGHVDPKCILLATLEETGHISAIPMQRGPEPADDALTETGLIDAVAMQRSAEPPVEPPAAPPSTGHAARRTGGERADA
jgi:uncharacterized membrane protein YcaP (DUF421 family)